MPVRKARERDGGCLEQTYNGVRGQDAGRSHLEVHGGRLIEPPGKQVFVISCEVSESAENEKLRV